MVCFGCLRTGNHLTGLADFERLGNPGWNWSNFEKYVARTEGYVKTERTNSYVELIGHSIASWSHPKKSRRSTR